MAKPPPAPRGPLSSDQFVALEAWLEAVERRAVLRPTHAKSWRDATAEVHRTRQRAFTLLTGIDGPGPTPSEPYPDSVAASGSDVADDYDDIA